MDARTLEGIVKLHQAGLYRYVRYLGARRSVAEDVVQDAFLDAFRRPGPLEEADERGAAGWLRGIARNKFLKHCRAAKRDPVAAGSEVLEGHEATWRDEFLRDGDGFDYVEALRSCVDGLPENQRLAVDMQYSKNAARAEIAEALALSTDGVKSLMRRIRAALADCVKRTFARAEGVSR